MAEEETCIVSKKIVGSVVVTIKWFTILLYLENGLNAQNAKKTTLFRKKEVYANDEMFQQNASKFA